MSIIILSHVRKRLQGEIAATRTLSTAGYSLFWSPVSLITHHTTCRDLITDVLHESIPCCALLQVQGATFYFFYILLLFLWIFQPFWARQKKKMEQWSLKWIFFTTPIKWIFEVVKSVIYCTARPNKEVWEMHSSRYLQL